LDLFCGFYGNSLYGNITSAINFAVSEAKSKFVQVLTIGRDPTSNATTPGPFFTLVANAQKVDSFFQFKIAHLDAKVKESALIFSIFDSNGKGPILGWDAQTHGPLVL
jgi:hypothetical protein